MNFYSAMNDLMGKLEGTLIDENLVCSLHTSSYPITLTVSRNASPEAQMELYSVADGDVSSNGAKLRFIFKLNELEIRTDERFVISDAFMSKIKGLAKKIHHAFLEGYFAQHISYNAPTEHENNSPKDTEGEE